MNTKKNERFAETDRRIRKAFTKMVLNKKTNQISVREICEATGINRSSFYLHYADIPALITAIVWEKWTESVERIHEEMHGDPNIFSEAYVAATLREAKRDRAFYRAYFEKFGTAELEKGYQTLFENVFKPFFRRLGINALWLSPVFRSPNDDNGYDISGYREIMDEFGTMEDWDALCAECYKRGIKPSEES